MMLNHNDHLKMLSICPLFATLLTHTPGRLVDVNDYSGGIR